MAFNQFNMYNLPPNWKKYLASFMKILPGLVLAIVMVIIFSTSIFQVKPEEIGIITRFGKYVRKEDPGLNFKLPLVEKFTRYRWKGSRRRNLVFVQLGLEFSPSLRNPVLLMNH